MFKEVYYKSRENFQDPSTSISLRSILCKSTEYKNLITQINKIKEITPFDSRKGVGSGLHRISYSGDTIQTALYWSGYAGDIKPAEFRSYRGGDTSRWGDRFWIKRYNNLSEENQKHPYKIGFTSGGEEYTLTVDGKDKNPNFSRDIYREANFVKNSPGTYFWINREEDPEKKSNFNLYYIGFTETYDDPDKNDDQWFLYWYAKHYDGYNKYFTVSHAVGAGIINAVFVRKGATDGVTTFNWFQGFSIEKNV